MASPKTIIINGREYDAVTGLPIDKRTAPKKSTPAPLPKSAAKKVNAPKPKIPRPASTPRPDVMKVVPKSRQKASPTATAVHSTIQRTQTLQKRIAKKPAAPQRPVIKRPTVGRQMDIAKSSSVSRFAKHPATKEPRAPAKQAPVTKKTHTTAVPRHPIAERALARSSAHTVTIAKPATAKQIKEAAIEKALAAPTPKAAKKVKSTNKHLWRRIVIVVISAVLAITILYTVYRLVPSISVSIASSQAGISASYPEYTPDGYSLSQPVTYSDGQVDLKFHSNSNDNYYTITQTRSSWDSSAVLDNVVTPAAGSNYVTTKERGLTIYSYNSDSIAVWVNRGILYKIDSKAPLSGDQIRRIATSL